MQAADKVEYHIGCAFEPEKNSLILVDESDRMMFEEPKAFLRFVNGTFCVCFTATPSNCDEHGVEAEVIKALGFKQEATVRTRFENDTKKNLCARARPNLYSQLHPSLAKLEQKGHRVYLTFTLFD